MKGKIYLIPATLGESVLEKVLPKFIFDIINHIPIYIVENTRTARRFLIKLGVNTKIDDLVFYEIDKHAQNQDWSLVIKSIEDGNNIGILSEAGCPGVADPGADIIRIAQEKNYDIVPLVGPSSILLALMASGLNGQNFAFNGYLPIKNPERLKKIKHFENRAKQEKQTQIFIETPYRNTQFVNDLITSCNSETLLCIACDITLDTELIKTKKIKDWKNKIPDINKRPAIFLIL